MCPCYKDYFKSEAHPYIKHFINFHSRRDHEHKIYVHFCSLHPFGTSLTIADHTGTIRKNVFVTWNMLT